jgi:ribosomal protein S18 acetylase RimI-like enzyme
VPRHLSIRRLTFLDDVTVSLIDRSCLSHAGWAPRDFEEFLAVKGNAGLAAAWDRLLIGYLLYSVSCQKEVIGLRRLGVHPCFRRRGIGSRLLARVVRQARRPPGATLFTLVHERHLDMQLFLRANGFRATRICRDFFDNGQAAGYLFEFTARLEK